MFTGIFRPAFLSKLHILQKKNNTKYKQQVLSDFLRVPFYVSTALKCKLPAYEIRLKGQFAELNLGATIDEGSEDGALDDSKSPRSLQQNSGHYLFVCRYCMWPHFYKDIWAKH